MAEAPKPSTPAPTPVSTARPAPPASEHPASPGAVGPPQPTLPTEPNPQSGPNNAQPRTPETSKPGVGPTTGSPSSGISSPTGLTPDKDIKERTAEANLKEAKDQKDKADKFNGLKSKVTIIYPAPGQNQKVHNPVTCHGACEISDSEEKPIIEVRIGGHDKKARAEIANGKWSAQFPTLPTGAFDFDLYVNDIHHTTARAEVEM